MDIVCNGSTFYKTLKSPFRFVKHIQEQEELGRGTH
jgi:hypothetical protein